MKTFFLTFTFLINLYSFSQHTFGFHANGGVSKLITTFKDEPDVYNSVFRPTVQAGVFYTFQVRNFFVGTKLSYLRLNGREHYENSTYSSSYNATFNSKWDNDTRIDLLEIPVFLGAKLKNLGIYAGMITSYTLYAYYRNSGYSYASGPGIGSSEDYDYSNSGYFEDIDFFNYGFLAGVSYDLSKKFTIEASYGHGINDLLDNPNYQNTLHSQQVLFGIRFNLLSGKI